MDRAERGERRKAAEQDLETAKARVNMLRGFIQALTEVDADAAQTTGQEHWNGKVHPERGPQGAPISEAPPAPQQQAQ